MKNNIRSICLALSFVANLVLPMAHPTHAATLAPDNLIQPYLVKDINIGSIGNDISGGIVAGNHIFFGGAGTQIWHSDGTTSGTSLVPNVPPAAQYTWISLVGAAKQRAYFNFNQPDSDGGAELWWTDGTNTHRAKSGLTGDAMFHLNGVDYVLDGGNSGLWKVDDATGDVSLAVALGSKTTAQTVIGNWLYYLSTPASLNPLDASRQLWRTDGTDNSAAHTQLIAVIPFTDIGPMVNANAIRQPLPISPPPPVTIKTAVLNNTLYIRQHKNLWKSDGTATGTMLISNAIGDEVGYYQTTLVAANGKLFFGSFDDSNTASFELWVSDGTPNGAHLLKDIQPGPSSSNLSNLKAIGNQLFFVADDGVHGAELWTSDGTTDGTHMVKEITLFGGATITEMVEWHNKIYFVANDQVHGSQIWISDGSETGTQLMAPMGQIGGLAPNPTGLTPYGDLLFFSADVEGYGREPWLSDGTPAGTRLLRDTVTYGADSKAYVEAVAINKVFFSAEDYTHGLALWASDGSEANTQLVLDLDNGMVGGYKFRYMGEGNGSAYFQVRRNPSTPADTLEVWRTDGTITGTSMITSAVMPTCFAPLPALVFDGSLYYFKDQTNLLRIDLASNSLSLVQVFSEPLACFSQLQISANKLFLSEFYGRLWRIEPQGATPLQPITSDQMRFSSLITVKDQSLFLLATDMISGATLWKTDGTVTGTTPIKSIAETPDYLYASDITTTPDYAYISVPHKDGLGVRLWRTDGSISNTVVLTTTTSEFSLFSTISNTVIYALKSPTVTLWTVSSAMTEPVPLAPNLFDYVVFPTPANNALYFVAYPNNGGNPITGELWRTDGTPSNLKRVAQFVGFGITQPAVFGNGVVFATSDDAYRTTLWTSDGNSVTRHFDLPYVMSTIHIVGDHAFFTGGTAEQGRELWAFRFVSTSNVAVQANAVSPSPLTSTVSLPFAVLNENFNQSATITLTATLPVSVTYVTDTLGISPTLNGNTVSWQITDLGFGQRNYSLKLQVPDVALGTRYPLTFTVGSSLTDTVAADNITMIDIWLTAQTFLPLSLR